MDKNTTRDEFAQAFDDGIAIDDGAVTEADVIAAADSEAEPESPDGDGDQQGATAADPQDAPAAEEPADPAAQMELERQRLRSWEGRLKAREAQIKDREAQIEQRAAGDDDGAAADAVEQVADAVAAGEPLDEVLMQLEDDFGPEFVQALSSLVDAKVSRIEASVAKRMDERVSGVNADVGALIEAIKNDRQREHFEHIADRHPDFTLIAASAPFAEWVSAKGEEAQNIVNAGSARQVCALLDEFKRGQAKGTSTDNNAEQAQAAAVAVPARAAGLRLPATPASSDDYMSAWDEA